MMDKKKKREGENQNPPGTALPRPEIFPPENPEFPGDPTVPNRAWTSMLGRGIDILTDDEKRNLYGRGFVE